MSEYEVPDPILNSPFHEPAEHWNIVEGEEPDRRAGGPPCTSHRDRTPMPLGWDVAAVERVRPV